MRGKRLTLNSKFSLKQSISKLTLGLATIGLLVPAIAAATATTTSQQFTDPAAQPGDNFGISVSLSSDGNTAVVGAPTTDVGSSQKNGAAYVFVKTNGTWTENAQLAASDSTDNDSFGNSVAITPDGSKIIVGSYHPPVSSGQSPGKAYIYNEPGGVGGSWSSSDPLTESVELNGSDSTPSDLFGWSVALSDDGNTALIGSKFRGPNTNEGAAYLLRTADNWASHSQTILQPSDAPAFGSFGFSVALSDDGNTALVGAPADGSPNPGGNAYEYTAPVDGWPADSSLTETNKLAHAQGGNDDFGSSVTLTGDGIMAAVGAPSQTVGSVDNAGAFYIFGSNAGAWSQTDEQTDPTPVQFDDFGWSSGFATDGSSLLIGSINANQTGAVYKYLPNGDGTWHQQQQLAPESSDPNQDFGWSVAVTTDTDANPDTDNVFIGAPAFDANSGNSAPQQLTAQSLTHLKANSNTSGSDTQGAAYLFDVTPPSISNVTPNTGGVGASVTINGDHLTGATSVKFNGHNASYSVSSDGTSIQTTVPTGATTGSLSVTTPNGTVSSPFTVNPIHAPIITSLTPTASAGQGEGDRVIIKGKYFQNASVSWNGQVLSPIHINPANTGVTVVLPLNAVSGFPLVLSTPSGTVQTANFNILPPSISSIPSSAKKGAKITIKGINMAGVTQVKFNINGVNVTPMSATDKVLTVVIPKTMPSGSTTITISAPSGQSTSSSLTIQ